MRNILATGICRDVEQPDSAPALVLQVRASDARAEIDWTTWTTVHEESERRGSALAYNSALAHPLGIRN